MYASNAGTAAYVGIAVGRDSATAGETDQADLGNGDLADRSACDEGSSPKRPGILFNSLGSGGYRQGPFHLFTLRLLQAAETRH